MILKIIEWVKKRKEIGQIILTKIRIKKLITIIFLALSETHSTIACYMKCEILSGISASMYSGNFHSSQRGKKV